MNVLEIILKNWQLIASAILLIVSLVLTIIRAVRNKSDVFADLKKQLLEQLPYWMSLVECPNNGAEKKVQVLQDALTYSTKVLGHKLSDAERDYIIAYCDKQIESILGTPQKKLGEKANVKGRR